MGFYLNNQEIYEESGTIYGGLKNIKIGIKRGIYIYKGLIEVGGWKAFGRFLSKLTQELKVIPASKVGFIGLLR